MSSQTPVRPGVLTATAAPEPGRLRQIRVDQGSGSGNDLAPGRTSLLGAFPLGDGPAPPEDRHEGAPRECLAWAGWRVWRGFRMNDALLINLSRAGARVFLDELPPHRRALWLFLETPTHKAIVKARVIQTETAPNGQYVVQIEFREPCPYALFEAAVCGLTPCDPKARTAPAARAPRFDPPRRSRAPVVRRVSDKLDEGW